MIYFFNSHHLNLQPLLPHPFPFMPLLVLAFIIPEHQVSFYQQERHLEDAFLTFFHQAVQNLLKEMSLA